MQQQHRKKAIEKNEKQQRRQHSWQNVKIKDNDKMERTGDEKELKDEKKTLFLESLGFTVNSLDILNFSNF